MIHDRKGLWSGFTDLQWFGILFIFMFIATIFIFLQVESIVSHEIKEDLLWEAGYVANSLANSPITITDSQGNEQTLALSDYLREDSVDRDVLEAFAEQAANAISVPSISRRAPIGLTTTQHLSANVFIIHQGEVVACHLDGSTSRNNPSPCGKPALAPDILASKYLTRGVNERGASATLESYKQNADSRGISWVALPKQSYVGASVWR